MKYLKNEAIINFSKISHNDRDEEHRKNKELFDIRQDLSIDNEAKAKIQNEKVQIWSQDIIVTGLNREPRNTLGFVVFNAENDTKLYQRNLKALDKDSLTDIQDRL